MRGMAVQDPGAGRSEGERAEDRPSSDAPPAERQTTGPYARSRIRTHSAPPRAASAGRELMVGLFAVDRAGRVTPGSGGQTPVLRIATAVPAVPGTDRATFCEVAACGDGRTAIALGVVGTTDASAVRCAHDAERLLGGWLGHGLEPAGSLDALRAWSDREGERIAHLGAVLCIVDAGRGCLTYCTAGSALVAVLAGGSRYLAAPLPSASTGPAAELASVLLPGDRLVLWSGDAPGLSTEEGQAFVREVLVGTPSPAAWRLIRSAGSGAQPVQAAVVVDVGA